jgi:hypothetical protein
MLYVEKDLAQCVKVAFEKWDTEKLKLNHQYFYVANMRLTPNEYRAAIEKGSSRPIPQNMGVIVAAWADVASNRTKVYIYGHSNDRGTGPRYHVQAEQRYWDVWDQAEQRYWDVWDQADTGSELVGFRSKVSHIRGFYQRLAASTLEYLITSNASECLHGPAIRLQYDIFVFTDPHSHIIYIGGAIPICTCTTVSVVPLIPIPFSTRLCGFL